MKTKNTSRAMLVMDFIPVYARGRDISDSWIAQLRFAVKNFDRQLERRAKLSDLTADNLNDYIAARLKAGIARKTVVGNRVALMTLWREAARLKLTPAAEEVRKIKLHAKNPETWWPEQFARLITCVEVQRGRFPCGVKRSALLKALVYTAYYTGLRPSDLLDLHTSEVMSKGRLIIRQQKTGELIDAERFLARRLSLWKALHVADVFNRDRLPGRNPDGTWALAVVASSKQPSVRYAAHVDQGTAHVAPEGGVL